MFFCRSIVLCSTLCHLHHFCIRFNRSFYSILAAGGTNTDRCEETQCAGTCGHYRDNQSDSSSLLIILIHSRYPFVHCHKPDGYKILKSILNSQTSHFTRNILHAVAIIKNANGAASSRGRYFEFSSANAENSLVPLPARPSESVPTMHFLMIRQPKSPLMRSLPQRKRGLPHPLRRPPLPYFVHCPFI